MTKFLAIAAATLIAGAATVAHAMDHKGTKKHVPAVTEAAKSASAVVAHRAVVHKTRHVRHHLKKHRGHHPRHHSKK